MSAEIWHTAEDLAWVLRLTPGLVEKDPGIPRARHVRGRTGEPVWPLDVVQQLCEARGIDLAARSPVLQRRARVVVLMAKLYSSIERDAWLQTIDRLADQRHGPVVPRQFLSPTWDEFAPRADDPTVPSPANPDHQ